MRVNFRAVWCEITETKVIDVGYRRRAKYNYFLYPLFTVTNKDVLVSKLPRIGVSLVHIKTKMGMQLNQEKGKSGKKICSKQKPLG